MKFYLILFLLLLSTNTLFSQKSTDTPQDVVKFALTALTNGDIEKLITVTENFELRKAKELLASIDKDTTKKQELINQYKTLKSWEIKESKEHTINSRTLAIVSTKWIVIPDLDTTPEITDTNQTIYVNYMLEQFDGKWKIISRKSIN